MTIEDKVSNPGVIPETKDFIMIFGLGMIPWCIWVGIIMLRTNPSLVRRPTLVPAQQVSE